MSRGREALLLSLVVTLAVGAMVAFALLDRRDPNDHDGFYANDSIVQIAAYQAADTAAERFDVLEEEALWLGSYPPIARVALVATLGTWGSSRAGFRLSNLPFAVLLVFGTWLLGRQLGGARVGLLAALLVTGIPTMIVHSRKFAPPWHAAALTPLTWALLLLALRVRGRRGWACAIAAGAIQGARCYSHPIVYPDVGLSSALIVGYAGFMWLRERTPERRGDLLRVAVAGGIALLLASHVLGWGVLGLPPEYSFPRYRSSRGHVLAGGVDWGAVAGAVGLGVREWYSMHLLPAGFLIALGGLGAAAWRLVRGEAGFDRLAGRLLAIAILGQLPLALLTMSRGTFSSDWMHFEPAACVLVAWGVLGAAGEIGRPQMGWVGAAVVHSVGVVVVPFVLSFAGPSPYDDPGYYVEGPGEAFSHSSSGSLWNTHHIPIREPGALRRLSERMARLGAGGDSLQLADLTLRDADTSVRCVTAPAAGSTWVWGAPKDQAISNRWWSPWPPLLAGIPRVQPSIVNAASVGSLDWRVAPAAGDIVTASLQHGRRPVVIRLWAQLDRPTRDAWQGCLPSQPSPAAVEAARDLLEQVLPDHHVTDEYVDLGDELVGLEDGRFRDALYQSYALLMLPY